ncbi:type II toxin-antitoxin system HicB family antitoxin [Candidatus Vondammii sp. HM_W22]|uniref:type II toxin-antitoxin system HicB family antitoxin n=1 Tax=Candidatus Vondammii sp. HM_W22 TaxID=2687299 RepID=UPI001F144BE0|nr:type II toxin-antitoxin system HicB family antitoxin [Candidatus Vondammii sp. HM_W22]
MNFEDYPINVSPIPADEGGGYMVSIPDFPGCIADGNTIDDAIAEAHDAFDAWVMAEQEDKGELPVPKTYSGQFVQRIPKSLHRQLAKRAETEGVSLNQLATTLLAQGLVRH